MLDIRLPPGRKWVRSALFWVIKSLIFFLWCCGTTRARASSFLGFLDHTQRRNTVAGTPLDEWSARRRDLYLTTHNIHNRQTSMPPAGFEPTIPAGERPQSYVLDHPAIGTAITLSNIPKERRFLKKYKITLFWCVMPCSVVHVYRSTRGTGCLHHRGTLLADYVVSRTGLQNLHGHHRKKFSYSIQNTKNLCRPQVNALTQMSPYL